MRSAPSTQAACSPARPSLLGVLALALLMLVCLVQAAGPAAAAGMKQTTLGSSFASKAMNASATVEQCVSASTQAERSVTFAGEMNAIAGSARMEIRIEVLERMPGEPTFRTVTAPGLGVWRSSVAGVKVYKYLKQVTNLSAPALYRAAVRFHWLNAKGKLIKAVELHTPKCQQPLTPDISPTGASPAPAS